MHGPALQARAGADLDLVRGHLARACLSCAADAAAPSAPGLALLWVVSKVHTLQARAGADLDLVRGHLARLRDADVLVHPDLMELGPGACLPR